MQVSDSCRSRIFCVLHALGAQPAAFRTFMWHLTPADLDAAVALVADLAVEDDVAKNDCAEMLAWWCALTLLDRAFSAQAAGRGKMR